MQELAAVSVGAEPRLVELHTRLSLEVGRHVLLLDKLMRSVSEGTRVLEDAGACENPVPAHFGPQLSLVLLDKLISVLLGCEDFLRPLDSSHFFILADVLHLINVWLLSRI